MPQDRQVYSELNKQNWAYTPTLVRWRHRYRGVRESLKFNQAQSQTLYDIYFLDKKLNEIIESLDDTTEKLYNGKDDYDTVDYYYDTTDDTPVALTTDGINSLKERLTIAERTLRRLENHG